LEARALALRECLRWGEPGVSVCPQKRFIWAAPVMMNQRVAGGMAASVSEHEALAVRPGMDLRRACQDLRRSLEAANLTNAAVLERRRQDYQSEQQRAYALHALKARPADNIRDVYLREEPLLFSAIRSGDRGRAREILNRILVVILQHGRGRFDLVKSLLLELVISMSRTGVESGGDPHDLLGANYYVMTELSQIASEEALAAWLRRTLESMMDSIQRQDRRAGRARLFDALALMEERCGERVTRDEAARAARLSPSRFSVLLRQETGATFNDLLNGMRVDRARRLLRRSSKPLSIIALECGFADQSYFTKVFRRHAGMTPRRYRREAGEGAQGGVG